MGIKGIYKEIGPGDRIALSKLAVEFFEKTGRPLRLAIDISIWLFQIQAGEGGSNPALRTFYYRILRLISLSIHPVFVFDGPNKPPFKRNKRTMAPGVKTVSIPEFLAKQLLKHFALPVHLAPGEAEAECALLQRLGYVDAVLSEDADTLMFGSGLTLRNLSPEGSLKTKVATHVNIYDADKVKANAGLDRHGMVLVALMSGGDYIPEGIPGCGPKIACQAARAGFGRDLCSIERDDQAGLDAWKDRLSHELRTNESKFFSRKSGSLNIPDDFPRRDILRFYTHPCVSSERALPAQLGTTLEWDKLIDIQALRIFAGDAFEWFYVSGAKKFIRNLAPALLAQELRLQGSKSVSMPNELLDVQQRESRLIKSIHLKRTHVSTDGMTELRVGFVPVDLVPLDLESETPDPETTEDIDLDEEGALAMEGNEEPSSPKKKRGPSTYDPSKLEKVWLMESFVKIGVPLKVQDWESSLRNNPKNQPARMNNDQDCRSPSRKLAGAMPKGALDRFTRVTKNPTASQQSSEDASQGVEPALGSCAVASLSRISQTNDGESANKAASEDLPPLPPPNTPSKLRSTMTINLLSSPDQGLHSKVWQCSQSKAQFMGSAPQGDISQCRNLDNTQAVLEDDAQSMNPLPRSVSTRRRRSPLRRAQTVSTAVFNDPPALDSPPHRASQAAFQKPPELPKSPSRNKTRDRAASSSPKQGSRSARCPLTPVKGRGKHIEMVNLCSSPSTPKYRQRSITEWTSPQKTLQEAPETLETRPTTEEMDQNLLRPDLAKELRRRDRLPPLTETPAAALNTTLPLQPRYESAEPSSRSAATGTGNIIRLRESLDGAWGVQKRSSGSRFIQNDHDDDLPLGRKKKRTQWRASEVEVLDLTGV